MKSNQNGFSAVETVLLVIIVGLVGAVGWLVYKNQSKTDTSSSQSNVISENSAKETAVDPFEGWKTYSSASISLRYPANWIVKDLNQGSNSGTQLIAPHDDTIVLNNAPTAIDKHLVINIVPLSQATSAICREDCKVYSTTSLVTAESGGLKLVISDWGSQGYAQVIEAVDDSSADIGATTYKLGATIGGESLRIYGDVNYDTDRSFGSIADVPDFEKTQTFQNLVKILNSMTVK